MKYLLLLVFSIAAQAGIKVHGDQVQPFTSNGYPLRELIRDYAEMTATHVVYSDKTFDAKDVVQLQLNRSISKADFKQIFYALLNAHGFSPMEESGFLWITASRDNRYLPGPVFTDDSYPRDAGFKLVVHTLKYPLASSITRNLRPYVSRYGRVINFSDARTIILSDLGDNIARLVKLVESMDTELAYQQVLKETPKAPEVDTATQEKIVSLELENKILERKYLELKEKNASGGVQ
jgi:type II secretory pathway component GspD/PulD (secretin)